MQTTARSVRAPAASAEPEDLVSSVHGVMGAVLRRAAPSLEEEGITMGQFWALHLVSSLEHASLTSVARHLSVAPPTVCAKVDDLVRAGLVSRHRSEKDRRTVELSLTPAGRRVEARVWRAIGQMMHSATGGMPREDLATATRLFREIRARLDAPVPLLRAGAA
jgi:MarR family transcriptional regulator, organic hydroperoxide resistance regulator